jgi:hypothetical protein
MNLFSNKEEEMSDIDLPSLCEGTPTKGLTTTTFAAVIFRLLCGVEQAILLAFQSRYFATLSVCQYFFTPWHVFTPL